MSRRWNENRMPGPGDLWAPPEDDVDEFTCDACGCQSTDDDPITPDRVLRVHHRPRLERGPWVCCDRTELVYIECTDCNTFHVYDTERERWDSKVSSDCTTQVISCLTHATVHNINTEHGTGRLIVAVEP